MAQELVTVDLPSIVVPEVFAPDAAAAKSYVHFFTANIENPHTQRAYARSAWEFALWCEQNDLRALTDIEPFHVAVYIKTLEKRLADPSVKQHLAAIRMLFEARGRPGHRGQSGKPRARAKILSQEEQDPCPVCRGNPQAAGFDRPLFSCGSSGSRAHCPDGLHVCPHRRIAQDADQGCLYTEKPH